MAKVQSVTPAVKQNDASSADCDHRSEEPVTLLCQQLATKADECREIRDKLESIEAANARILRNQMEMQESFVKVMHVSSLKHLLLMLTHSVYLWPQFQQFPTLKDVLMHLKDRPLKISVTW